MSGIHPWPTSNVRNNQPIVQPEPILPCELTLQRSRLVSRASAHPGPLPPGEQAGGRLTSQVTGLGGAPGLGAGAAGQPLGAAHLALLRGAPELRPPGPGAQGGVRRRSEGGGPTAAAAQRRGARVRRL